jgi:hypothetical protein
MVCTASHFRTWPILITMVLWAGMMLPTKVAAGTVKLDGASYPIKEHGTIKLKTIEVIDTNLTDGEVARMFSATTAGEADALFARLEAAAVTIGEIAFVSADQTYTLHDFRATGVRNGKVDRLSVGGLDGHAQVPNSGTATVKVGAMTIEKGDFGPAFSGLATGQRPTGRMEATRVAVADVEVAAPDKDVRPNAPGGNLYRIRLASFEVNNAQEGSVEKSVATMKGLTIEPPKASEVARSLTLYGYDAVNIDTTFKGSYDKQSKNYALEDLTVSIAKVGSIKLEATFGGIDPAALTGDAESAMKALADGELSHSAVRITNSGYFEKALAVTAAQERKTPQQVRMQWTGAVEALAMDPAGGPAMKRLNAAVTAFISDPKSLTITLDAKTRPVKFIELGEVRSPDALLEIVDIDTKAGP